MRFGDDTIGKQLVDGNIVIIDYIVSSGAASNYVTTFSIPATLTATNEIKSISTQIAATGGAEKQSIDSIRNIAPKYNGSNNKTISDNVFGKVMNSVNYLSSPNEF